jgi:ABC-type nitrate/sulfonate/bicarbonate transport system substrate-binding protein
VPNTIRLGTFTPSVLLRVARRTGRLRDAGLEVAETPVQSSPGQFTSLLDGTFDAVLTSPDNVIAYRYSRANPLGRTADVRIVSAVDRGMGLALHSRHPPAELRGAVFGVDVPASGFAFAMYALAESLGLERDDYEVVALGSTPKRLLALLAGECAATMLNAGNELHAERAGYRALARASDVCGPYLGTVLATVGDPGAPEALAKVLTETSAEILSGALDDEVVEVASTALNLPDPLGHSYLDRLKDPAEGLVPDGVVDPAAIAVLVDLRRRHGRVEAADTYVDALAPGSGLLVRR